MARTRDAVKDEPDDDTFADPDYEDEGEDEIDLDYEDDDGFEVDEALLKPSILSMTTKTLHSLVHQSVIDLNAEYQRDVVWNDAKQSHLINSIFRNIYIPPIVLAVSHDEDGEEVRMCVDGKQRLTSIVKFFDGQIPFKDRNGKSWWFTVPPSKKKGRQIPKYWKDEFSQKELTCVHYSNLSPDVEREIFQRVQLGVVLRESEKMQAITSPRVDFVHELQKQYFDAADGLKEAINWKVSRANDFQALAQAAFCIGNLPAAPRYDAGSLDRWLRAPEKPSAEFRRIVRDALTAMLHLAGTPGLDGAFKQVKKGVAPVEFVFLAILLHRMGDEFTHEERARAALSMRQRLRAEHKDAFARKDCFRTLTTYIDSVAGPADESLAPLAPAPPKKGKRKMDQDEDPDDPDFLPTKRPRARKPTGRA